MKLFVVVDKTLTTGLKAAQGIHAAFAFAREYPVLSTYWQQEHNNIVVLESDALVVLAARLEAAGFRLSRFHEPDLDGQLTALCIEPGAAKMLSNLPLARAAAAEVAVAA